MAFLLTGWSVAAFAQNQPAPRPTRPLLIDQSRYRLRAGDRVPIAAPQDTLDFLRAAKTRTVKINGTHGRGFVIAPNVNGDQVMLAASLTMKPGEYAITVSAVSGTGEQRAAALDVTLDPMQTVPNGSTVPPVVLLNGWQFPTSISELLSAGTCPVSQASDTFGSLGTELAASQSGSAGNSAYPSIDGAGAVVYFFDNCVEDPNGLIEKLGNVLGQVLNLITYENGTPVPQVDLVTHSMGGLIARAYLSGLQTTGALSPPFNPRVRKFVEIATPNFGSFLAANYSDLVPSGTQTAELVPGSTFLWYLATWNQHGDDLHGVDGLAIIGDAGYWQPNLFSGTSSNLSDGVVSITSASLGFVPLSYARSSLQTRILPYCHVDSSSSSGGFIDCTGPGIADAAETAAIVLSFLENTTVWETIGNSNQTQYGGLYFALENAAGTQYTALESVSLASVSFQTGWNDAFFFEDFVNGTGTLDATSTAGQGTNCGSYSVPVGYYTAVRCKFSPSISGVQSSLSTGLAGLTVASGSNLTISGTGFATGTSVFANGAALSAQIVSSQEITASLPSGYSGLVGLSVSNTSGADEINIFAAPPAQPPAISLSSTQLGFSYTIGGAAPATQTIEVTNSGGGTLAWSASSNSPWLTVSPASGTGSGTLTLGITTVGLSAQTYNGAITLTAAGASNSPQTISVSLTVNAAQPSISLSTNKATFSYTLGGNAPASQTINISNGGGGTLSWSASSNSSWLTVSPASGTRAGTLTLGINTSGLSAQTYNGTATVTASGAANSPQTISVVLTVNAAVSSQSPFTVTLSTAGQIEPFAAEAIVSSFGTNLSTGTGSATVSPLPTSLDGTTVTVTDSTGTARLAPLFFVSPTQINYEIPEGTALGPATVTIKNQSGTTQTADIQIGDISPGLFELNSPGLVAAWVLPIISGIQQSLLPVYQVGATNSVIALPVDLGPSTEEVYLEMYGTGFRSASSISVTVGGLSVPVIYFGPAPGFAGEDQVNIGPLPRSLTGEGTVSIVLTAEGQAANTVNVDIQ